MNNLYLKQCYDRFLNLLINSVIQPRILTEVKIIITKPLITIENLIMMPLHWENQATTKREKKVIIIGDFMINNINSQGLSKSKKTEVLHHP